MSGSGLIAMPGSGELAVWRIVGTGQPLYRARRASSWQVGVFCVGLSATAGGAAAVWHQACPDTVIRTRIVAEGATDLLARAALSDVALRLAATSTRANLQDAGEALDITVQDRDPVEAEQRSRSLVDALLNAPVAAPQTPAPVMPASPEARLRAERARVAAAADAVKAQMGAISLAQTGLARDMAAASRAAAEHKPGRETLEKGEAALADLQLQRLQLASKYQDTYPAVVALDGQIRNLHVFLVDEAHRIETRPATASPADALLGGERDRLRAEGTQLEDRRRELAGQMAKIDQQLAALPVMASVAAPPVLAPALILAGTTSFAGPDSRPTLIAAIAGAGLFLSGLLSLLARRTARPFPHRLVLNPVSGSLVGSDGPFSLAAPAAGLGLASQVRRAYL